MKQPNDDAILETATIRYDFGRLPKHEAMNMWQCDILTGELKKVKLEKETRWEMNPTGKLTKRGVPQKQLATIYHIMTKPNFFYMHGMTAEEAKAKFEAQFANLEKRLEEREAQKGKQDGEADKK